MRRRRPKRTAEQRARSREATRRCRERARKRLALFVVAIDDQVLDLLVRHGYIEDHQVIEKRDEVNRALSAYLWDCAHSLERLHERRKKNVMQLQGTCHGWAKV